MLHKKVTRLLSAGFIGFFSLFKHKTGLAHSPALSSSGSQGFGGSQGCCLSFNPFDLQLLTIILFG